MLKFNIILLEAIRKIGLNVFENNTVLTPNTTPRAIVVKWFNNSKILILKRIISTTATWSSSGAFLVPTYVIIAPF